MYGDYSYSKKNLNLLVLRILWEHTDEQHRLSQQEIVQMLESEYGIEVDRRTVKNNVLALQEIFEQTELEIECENGYCILSRPITDAELRILIDGILFSKNIEQKQAQKLITKLKSLSNKYFSARVGHVCNLPELQHTENKQLFYNVEIIDDAITQGKQISFYYNSYGTDLKLHPRRETKDVVNPYQMLANNGHYYLLCNYDKYDDLAHLRLDKMTQIELLPSKAKAKKLVPELAKGFSLPRHMAEHVYMYQGESADIVLSCDKLMLDELVDWFGRSSLHIEEETEKKLRVRVACNERAMFYWALQYGMYIEVLEPAALRKQLTEATKQLAKQYK